MKRLKDLLSDSSKNRRGRRNLLGLQITFLGWFVEVLAFLTIAVGIYIFGHGSSIITMSLQTLTLTFYFIILPCTILINDNELKHYIADTRWYLSFISFFGCRPVSHWKRWYEWFAWEKYLICVYIMYFQDSSFQLHYCFHVACLYSILIYNLIFPNNVN